MPSYLTPLVLWCPIYIVVLLFIQRYNDRKLLCQVMAVQQMCIIMSHTEGGLVHKFKVLAANFVSVTQDICKSYRS